MVSGIDIEKISLKGVLVLDENMDNVLSVGDSVCFNSDAFGVSEKDMWVSVTQANLPVIEKLALVGADDCENGANACAINIEQDGAYAAIAWYDKMTNSLSGVKFFGQYSAFVTKSADKG